MARGFFEIEKGFRIFKENSQTLFVDIIFDAGNPVGTSGETDAATVGSIYTNTTNGSVWKKTVSTSSASDWTELGGAVTSNLNWRPETVRTVTGDVLSAGVVNPTTFSDNESGLDGLDFLVGEHLISNYGSIPTLFRVTTVTSATSITIAAATTPLANFDTFVAQTFLPDSGATQEGKAIVHFPDIAASGVKIGDIDWDFATGINLSSGYASGPGGQTVTSSDTVESALQKLDGNQKEIDQNVNDLITLSGVAENSTVLGAFAAPGSFLLGASLTIKAALQTIADFLFGIKVTQTTGITATTAVDSVAHATYKRVQWIVHVFSEGTPANTQGFVIDALTDGTNIDETQYAKLKLGANIAGLTFTVAINGANMELRAAATGAVTVNVRRITVI